MKKMLASDSRWSFTLPDSPNLLAFVDDTGFDKLAIRGDHAMVFAGDGLLVEKWKQWFTQPKLDFDELPPVEREIDDPLEPEPVLISLIRTSSCEILYETEDFLAYGESASFAGSGASYAKRCYVENGCCQTAVATAGKHDPATGGETKFIDLSTRQHNLSQISVSLRDATQAFMERGIVMDITTKEETAFLELVECFSDFDVGSARLSAPIGKSGHHWTDHEKGKLFAALQDMKRHEEQQPPITC
ncbi:hypothetical protein [Pseudomonas parafulva]|uniref:hypothetical protein n=1 Tax=Pseudomonas parafulva TaxID=157782 RepID=UPI0005A76B16|nr:hypothetical protein [Pseudomonas parafulva]